MTWMRNLAPVAREEGMVSAQVDQFSRHVRHSADPSKLLRSTFVDAGEPKDFKGALAYLGEMKAQMEQIRETLLTGCRDGLLRAVGSSGGESVLIILKKWKATLPGDSTRYLTDASDSARLMKGFLTRIDTQYQTEEFGLRSLAELFAAKPIEHWNAASLSQFEVNLLQTVRKIESLADSLDLESLSLNSDEISIPWIERRLSAQLVLLKGKLGVEKTRQILERVLVGNGVN
jgi:hypothetical protein